MSWTCEQTEERLSDYLDGLLQRTERSECDAHLTGCARCLELVKQVGLAVEELHALPPLEPSPELLPRILERTLGPRRERRSWAAWFKPLWQPRFAFGLATVFVTFTVVFYGLGPNPTLALLNPVQLYRTADRRSHLGYARLVKFVNDLRLVYEIQSRLQPEAGAAGRPSELPRPEKPAKRPSGQMKPAVPQPSLVATALASIQTGRP